MGIPFTTRNWNDAPKEQDYEVGKVYSTEEEVSKTPSILIKVLIFILLGVSITLAWVFVVNLLFGGFK